MYANQVNWWTVQEFIGPFLAGVESWPIAGSVEWQVLHDGDPRKMAALLDAARHHALRVDTAQEARAEASQAVAGSADWKKIAQEKFELDAYRRMHPWAGRLTEGVAA